LLDLRAVSSYFRGLEWWEGKTKNVLELPKESVSGIASKM
jgi:hypothetical protein